VALDVHATDTVQDVKRKLQDKEAIPAGQQRLVFQTRELEDSRTLADYNIQRDSNLGLVLRLIGGANMFQLFVKTLGGRNYVLDVSHTFTVRQVKEQLEDRSGMPLAMQRLIYPRLGRQGIMDDVDNDRTIGSYGIEGEATIVQVPVPRAVARDERGQSPAPSHE
jgi:ubiquitin C